jgi:hypothetical protein
MVWFTGISELEKNRVEVPGPCTSAAVTAALAAKAI